MSLPLSFYLIPNVLGYGWSATGVPRLVATELRPAARAPAPDVSITAESWGASVISVPFNARVADYVYSVQLPLWNPYQALGQPFVAQAEGSPYAPLSVLRALLPERLHNVFGAAMLLGSSVFLYSLGRRLTLSRPAARFVAASWLLSPALSWHLARHNYLDQFALIPVLFWSLTRAALFERSYPWIATSFVIALFWLGGFVQAAVLAIVVGYVYAIFLITFLRPRYADTGPRLARITACFVLGSAFAAPFLLPIQELIQNGYAKNWLTFSLSLSAHHLYAFLFPGLLGAPFAESPYIARGVWGDTFASSGFLILLLILVGSIANTWADVSHRLLSRFLLATAAVLLCRAFNVPPISALNALPVIGLQTPKHAHSFIVFLTLLAAGFHLDNLALRKRRVILVAVASLLVFQVVILADSAVKTYYLLPYSSIAPNHAMMSYWLVILAVAISFVSFTHIATSAGVEHSRVIQAVTLLAVAELSFHLLLGLDDRLFYFKLLVSVCIVLAALFIVLNRRSTAVIAVMAGLGIYAVLVVAPRHGIPQLPTTTRTSDFVEVIKRDDATNYRSFGIPPDFSSTVNVQDISVVSPFTTMEFNAFVKLVANRSQETLFSFANSFFMLASRTSFPLTEYLEWKPVFDWFGVRYLVFDKTLFGTDHPMKRTDHMAFITDRDRFRVIYDDPSVTVVKSLSAQPKVMFSPSYEVVRSRAEIFRRLLRDPARISGQPMIEEAQAEPLGVHARRSAISREVFIPLRDFRANGMKFGLDATEPGIVVVRDSYSPGWHSRVNGVDTPVLRVNAIARGILVPRAGHVEVELSYMPDGFWRGCWLALLAASVMISIHLMGNRNSRLTARISAGMLILASLATLMVYLFAFTEKLPARHSAVVLEPGEVFLGFDLRRSGPIVYRFNHPTDNRSLILRPWGKVFPSARIGPTPLPLVAGDVFIDSGGSLVEVDVDSTLLHMKPAAGTRVCLLDTSIRGANDWETTTLPLPVVGQLRYTGTEWVPDGRGSVLGRPCTDRHATGRIRFGWLPKQAAQPAQELKRRTMGMDASTPS